MTLKIIVYMHENLFLIDISNFILLLFFLVIFSLHYLVNNIT